MAFYIELLGGHMYDDDDDRPWLCKFAEFLVYILVAIALIATHTE